MLKSGPPPHHPLFLMPPCTSSSHTKFTLVPRRCYEASHRVSCLRIFLPLIYLQNILAVFSSSQPPGCPVQGQPTHVDVNTLLSTAAPTSCCHCLHTLLGWAMSVQKTGVTSLILLTSVSQVMAMHQLYKTTLLRPLPRPAETDSSSKALGTFRQSSFRDW